MSWVAGVFRNEFELPENRLYLLPNVKKMILRLFSEACKGLEARWQWKDFYLDK